MGDYLEMRIELVLARFRPEKIVALLVAWGSKWPECNDQPPSIPVLESVCRELLWQCQKDGHPRVRHEIVATYIDGEFGLSCSLQRVTSHLVQHTNCSAHNHQNVISDLTSCLRAMVHQNGGRVTIPQEMLNELDVRDDLEMRSQHTEDGLVLELVPAGEEDETEHDSGG